MPEASESVPVSSNSELKTNSEAPIVNIATPDESTVRPLEKTSTVSNTAEALAEQRRRLDTQR